MGKYALLCNIVPTKTVRKKTPNAVLPWVREVLGLTQSDLANKIGAVQSTIQAVELGRLPLSERFAWAISEQTGVDARWLLAGKLPHPLPDSKLVREQYERAKKGDLDGLVQLEHLYPRHNLFQLYILLRNIASELGSKGAVASGFDRILQKVQVKCLATIKDRKMRKRVWTESHRVMGSSEAMCALLISDAQELRQAMKEVQEPILLVVDTKGGRPKPESVRLASTLIPTDLPPSVPFLVPSPAPEVPAPAPETGRRSRSHSRSRKDGQARP
jgi:transcriptional regulator with XRE-family HTH domain